MATSQSQSATSLADWNKRAAKYNALGIDPAVYTPIAQYDMNRTETTDAPPMSNLEADLSVYAAATQSQPISHGPKSPVASKDPLADIGTFLGNAGADARNIVLGIPRGVATSVIDLFKPSTYRDIGRALEGRDPTTNTRETGGLGGYVRGLAAAPELGTLIPGLSDVADLTTAAGRQQLLTHPVSAVADIAPYVGRFTRLAATGSIAALSDTERASLAADPSALAAAAAGKPIVFGLRAADRTIVTKAALSGRLGASIQRVARAAQAAGADPFFEVRGLPSDAQLGIGQYAIRRQLAHANLDTFGKAVSTAVSRQTAEAYRQSTAFRSELNKLVKPIVEQAGGGERGAREVARFSEKIRTGDFSDLTNYEQSIIPKLREYESRFRERGVQSGDLTSITDPFGEGYEGVFAAESPVAKHYAKLQTLTDRLSQAQSKLAAELDRQRAQAEPRTIPEREISVTRGPRAGTTYTRLERTTSTPVALPPNRWTRDIRLPTTGTQPISHTIGFVRKGERDLQNRVEALTRQHQAQLARFQTAYIRHPPPALDPRILIQMQDYARRETRARYNVAADTPTAAERNSLYVAGKLDEFNQTMERINNDPSMAALRSLVGKQQWDTHLTDVVQENARLAASGNGPIYFHTVTTSDLTHGSVTRVKLVNQRAGDEVEGMYRDASLKYNANTVFNFVAGFTRSALDTFERDGMRSVYEGTVENGRLAGGLKSLEKVRGTAGDKGSLYDHYLNLARITHPNLTQQSLANYATQLLHKEWVPYDYTDRGIRWTPPAEATPATMYLPKSVANNLRSFAEGDTNRLFSNPIYRKGMRVFRTSVLYGPRHFAHTVLGGMMPMLASEPRAFLELARSFPHWRALMSGTADERFYAMPALFKHVSDWTVDEAFQMRAGYQVGNMLKQYWAKTGKRVSDGLGEFETIAHSMYQYSVYASKRKHGMDPDLAVEAARQVVVNFDSMSPFERTVMKQMMPFYSFTRFAMQYMLKYPTDHPLRFSALTQMGSQTAEEWSNSGLPMEMMADIFFGKPSAQGNQFGVSYANMNPFRSVFNEFTFGGLISSLNPAIGSLFEMAGVNVLSGSPASLYPKAQYNPNTGGLSAAPPSVPGRLLLGAEQIVPQLNWVDLIGQVNSTIRTTDPAAFDRALWSAANLPFTPSMWNIPQERSEQSQSLYTLAQQAVSEYTRYGNPQILNRFNLIPFESHLYTPQQFESWWNNLSSQYASLYPNIDPRSLIPSSGYVIPGASVSGNASTGLLGQITTGPTG